MAGPLIFAALGALAIVIGIFGSRGQERMLAARVDEGNAKVAKNTTKFLFVGLGVVFIAVAVLGVIGELARS